MATTKAAALPAAVVLALRLLTLALLAASLAVVATNKLDIRTDDPPQKVTFRDVYAYRYLLAVAVVGCAYTLLQVPVAAVSVARRGRAVGGGGVALLLVSADVALALVLATGAAAGLGLTYDARRYFDGVLHDAAALPGVDRLHRDMDRFFNLAYASAGLMLAAAACMALMIMISVYALVK
ncbi:hypothetical protein ACP70R_007580 [Stipagrostis hirtigluma subsp. patula]